MCYSGFAPAQRVQVICSECYIFLFLSLYNHYLGKRGRLQKVSIFSTSTYFGYGVLLCLCYTRQNMYHVAQVGHCRPYL